MVASVGVRVQDCQMLILSCRLETKVGHHFMMIHASFLLESFLVESLILSLLSPHIRRIKPFAPLSLEI